GVRRGDARVGSARVGLRRAFGRNHARRRAGPRRGGGCRHGRALDARVPRSRTAGRTPAAALPAARRRAGGVRAGDLRSGHLDALRARPVTTFFFLQSANQLALTATIALAHGAGTPPGIAVAVPRITDAAVTIDGRLDEPVWGRAAPLREFSQYVPNDDRPAEDSTTVLVWYSPTAIYFGIRAYQDSASVRATQADRDKITGDDYVDILLDTFDDHRQALVFGVNPFGVQADGTLLDAPRQIASTLSAVSTGAYILDLSPDYVYESKGHLTAWGYEVEVRIPFKTLRYQARDAQNWGLNVIRVVQATGHQHTWTRVLQTRASFLAQGGTLTGLTGL